MSLRILNFHGVGPIRKTIDDAERSCWLDQEFFETVLDLVQGHPHVNLTFDDGNASDFEIALPALLRRRLHATFFICSGRVDQPSYLSRAQVLDLQAHGMGIGSHGINHVPWGKVTLDVLRDEIQLSRQVLQDICQQPIEAVACPFGSYNRRVLKALREAGYRFVYTSDGGDATKNQWLRARNSITRSLSIDVVRQLVVRRTKVPKQAFINLRKLVKYARAW